MKVDDILKYKRKHKIVIKNRSRLKAYQRYMKSKKELLENEYSNNRITRTAESSTVS